MVRHVEHALAAPGQHGLVQVTRTTMPAGWAVHPGGPAGLSWSPRPGSPREAGYQQDLLYHGRSRMSAFTAAGQRVFDLGITLHSGSLGSITVDYRNQTWWRPGLRGLPPEHGAGLGGPCGGPVQSRLAVVDWAKSIRGQLRCGELTVAGRQQVDGVDAIKITSTAAQTLWVSPTSYLPVRLVTGRSGLRMQSDFRWLDPTRSRLRQLKVTIPAGFKQVPAPVPPQAQAP